MTADEIIEEAIRNVKSDRQAVQVQITDLNKSMVGQTDMSKHASYGMNFSKYAETLQRSNEQLIKLAELKRKMEETKKDDESLGLDDNDVDSFYDSLKKEE